MFWYPDFDRFRQGFVHYLITATCSEKNTPEKFPFIATNNWILLTVRWSVKYFVLWILQYSWKVATKKKKQKKQKKAIVKHYAFQANIITNYTSNNYSTVYLQGYICKTISLQPHVWAIQYLLNELPLYHEYEKQNALYLPIFSTFYSFTTFR